MSHQSHNGSLPLRDTEQSTVRGKCQTTPQSELTQCKGKHFYGKTIPELHKNANFKRWRDYFVLQRKMKCVARVLYIEIESKRYFMYSPFGRNGEKYSVGFSDSYLMQKSKCMQRF